MTLEKIFDKPVNRHIEGVIKADDDSGLRLEMEEYVLTNEVARRLETFLDEYKNYEGANGVWISGFFGSGKSHLLKMLAHLLENRNIDGVSALELFQSKCGENEFLRADLHIAATIPSKSILFNIDQKADVISKTQMDALLAVFVKVFDEMCGYYGKQGHIAQFERELDSRGLFDKFQAVFQSLAGYPWEKGREQALLESQNIASAYAEVSGEAESLAKGILDKYRSQYRLSIEDFAKQVKKYIDQQVAGFRLNFFVDEVGQYIADNVKLMTNLQTIAESLATKCQGRAWIIVTAQEDMDTVVGEMNQQKGSDFSKIQDRFAIRMKLTSTDVAEVIEKRLLKKNEEGIRLLAAIYHKESNNLKTLFDFAEGSQSFRNFQDRDHFIQCYPFIPYQVSLFQTAIQKLSQHSAFEGKHRSVGERSMLGVFQQVAIQIRKRDIGQLATFDLMFEGIRSSLKSSIQRAILQAEKNLDNLFAIRLLKVLFLVKYIKEFKSTQRNLSILMIEGFSQDLSQLHKTVAEALNLLEQQTYIQRNGENYEFLTDEEKNVEVEIKNTEVESSDVAAELEKIIFDRVINTRKIRYRKTGQDYPYARKLDDKLHGREYELAINVISPFHGNAGQETSLIMNNMGRDELLVILPPEDKLMREILMYKRTEKYIRQNSTITQQEAVKRVLSDKSYQNSQRYEKLRQLIQGLMSKAKLFVEGSEIETSFGDAQTRIVLGFNELIARAYPNLRMLRGVSYTEGDISSYLKQTETGFLGSDLISMSESVQEVFAFIQGNQRNGLRTTMKSLLEKFEHKPYGWYPAAILYMLAQLCAHGKVEVKSDSNILEDKELERALLNTRDYGNIVLDPQAEFTASQERNLKKFYEEFFDITPSVSDAKALGKETSEALKKRIEELNKLKDQIEQYPFLASLAPVLEYLSKISGKPYVWYLTELIKQEDRLLVMKREIIEPIRRFMNGTQKLIYKKAREFVQKQEPNFACISGSEAQELCEILNDPECFNGSLMQQAKRLLDVLSEKISLQIKSEITKAEDAVNVLKKRLSSMEEFAKLSEKQKEEIRQPFMEFSGTIQQQKYISAIREMARSFEENEYQRLLGQVTLWTQPVNKSETQKTKIEYVSSRAIKVPFEKAWIADEKDVDNYIKAMRKALLAEINKGKRIQI